jgi:hypothetical protein
MQRQNRSVIKSDVRIYGISKKAKNQAHFAARPTLIVSKGIKK